MSNTAEDLRAGAAALFDAQNPLILSSDNRARYDARGIEEQVIGACPGHYGAMLRVSVRWPPPGSRMTIVSFREFIVGPSGDQYPTKYGMTLDARVMPSFGHHVAETLKVLEQAEGQRPRARGDRR